MGKMAASSRVAGGFAPASSRPAAFIPRTPPPPLPLFFTGRTILAEQPKWKALSSLSLLSAQSRSFDLPFTLRGAGVGHHPSLQAVGSMNDTPPVEPTLLVIVAVVLAVASQSLINSRLRGDQGLSAFLRDGDGYSGSAFQPRSKKNTRRNNSQSAPLGGPDPLPWLKLPKFDFVEVAGQEEDNVWVAASSSSSSSPSPTVLPDETPVEEKMNNLQEISQQMDEAFARGNLEEAQALRAQVQEMQRLRKSENDDENNNLE